MKKRALLLLMTAIIATSGNAQMTLEQCKRMACDNYPAVKQYGLIEQSRDYTVANAAKGYFPQISASAGAYAFTDIIDSKQAGMTGGMGNELYNVGIQISQVLYDGGAIAARKRMAKAQAEVSSGMLDVTMYDIGNRVEQIYFGILTLDEQMKQNRLLQHDLGISEQSVKGMMSGGVANQSDLDAVNVEQIKARQAESSLIASKQSYIRMLSTFIGKQLHDSTTLSVPSLPAQYAGADITNRRPELEYYNAQSRLLDEQHRSLKAGLMPQLSAFGMGMYHNKVMSMMNNSLLAAGLSLNWDFGALYTHKNDIRKIANERLRIDSERETFLFNTCLQSENTNGQINSLRQQIALDSQIINLRENIRSKSETKVRNGTETVNEMLRDINAVSEARQTKAVHEIQLLKELYNLKNINNN